MAVETWKSRRPSKVSIGLRGGLWGEMITLERSISAHVFPLASHMFLFHGCCKYYYPTFQIKKNRCRETDTLPRHGGSMCKSQTVICLRFFFSLRWGKPWKEEEKGEPKRCETRKGKSQRNSELSNLSRKIRQRKSEMIRFFSFIPIQANNMHSDSSYSSPVCTYFPTHSSIVI